MGEFTDGERRTLPGDFRAQGEVDAAPILHRGVEDGLVDRDVFPGDLRESEDVLVQLDLSAVRDVGPHRPVDAMKHVEWDVGTEAADVLQEGVAKDGVRPPETYELALKIVEKDRPPLRRDVDVVQVEDREKPLAKILPKCRGLFEGFPVMDRQLLLGHDGLHLGPDLDDLLVFVGLERRLMGLIPQLGVLWAEVDANECERRVDRVGHVHRLSILKELAAHVS